MDEGFHQSFTNMMSEAPPITVPAALRATTVTVSSVLCIEAGTATLSVVTICSNGAKLCDAGEITADTLLGSTLGAFAAHGLDLSTEAGRKAREWLQTGSQYEMIHALAILGVVALARGAMLNAPVALVTQCLFLTGSVLFPGALYERLMV